MLPAPTSTDSASTGPASRLALELAIVPSVNNRPAAPDFEPPAAQPELAKAIEQSPKTTLAAESPASAKQPPNLPRVADTVIAAKSAIPPTSAKAVDNGVDVKTAAAPANPQIDKRSQQLTPRELAENEYRDAANLLGQGRYAEAQEGFRRALQISPWHIGARQGLFGLLAEAKKNDEAEQVLADGLKLNPNQPGFALALSGLQYQRGDMTGAIETLQRTAPAAQGIPEYLARLAAMLQRQARHQEAVDYFQAALRLAPGSGVWLMGLGISQQALNRNSEAKDAFKRAKATRTLNADLEAFVDQRLKQLQ
jgi:MSHA biogenesis protein MshN